MSSGHARPTSPHENSNYENAQALGAGEARAGSRRACSRYFYLVIEPPQPNLVPACSGCGHRVLKFFLSRSKLQAYHLVMSVEEIEAVVSGLSAAELARFSQWFEEFIAGQWDRQIEQDMLAGRLDAAIKRADDHYKAGHCTPL